MFNLFCVRTEPPCCFYIPVDELKLNSILQKLVLCILNHIGLSYWDGHHCGTQRRPRLSPDCASEGGRRVGQPSQTPPTKICLKNYDNNNNVFPYVSYLISYQLNSE